MRNKILSIVLLAVFLTTTAFSPAATHATTAAADGKTLTVLAAASLTESFTELGKTFESKNAGVKVAFNFAGSQSLAQQLGQGAEADVFASASKKYMDTAVEAKRVNKDDAKTFANNRLVVIYPKANPAGLKELKDLAKTGIKLDLADKAVPVGQYALDFLDKAAKDAAYGADYKDAVLKNVVSYEDNVKAVVTKVTLGEVDAGIVYVTDITADAGKKTGKLEIPDALNSIAAYPIAAIRDSRNPELAKAFVDLVLSADGQKVMEKYGFIPAVAGGITITDALGRTVTLPKTPSRIVLSGKALFMVADAIYVFPEAGRNITALGSTVQGAGDFIPMIDSTFKEKTMLDGNAGAEQIAAVKPDCAILKSSTKTSLGDPLEQLGIPVIYVDFETPEQYDRDMKTLGAIFQNMDRAAKVLEYFTGKTDAVKKAVSTLKDDQKPKTLILYYSAKEGAVSFNVPPMGWMQTTLVELAGGTPVWKDANPGKGWTQVTLEQIAAWNPDDIFVVAYSKPAAEAVKALLEDPQWKELKAAKDGKIYPFAADVYSWDQPDTRWILGLQWVAAKLHPDQFKDWDVTAAAKDFYKEIYAMNEASFSKNIAPLLAEEVK